MGGLQDLGLHRGDRHQGDCWHGQVHNSWPRHDQDEAETGAQGREEAYVREGSESEGSAGEDGRQGIPIERSQEEHLRPDTQLRSRWVTSWFGHGVSSLIRDYTKLDAGA